MFSSCHACEYVCAEWEPLSVIRRNIQIRPETIDSQQRAQGRFGSKQAYAIIASLSALTTVSVARKLGSPSSCSVLFVILCYFRNTLRASVAHGQDQFHRERHVSRATLAISHHRVHAPSWKTARKIFQRRRERELTPWVKTQVWAGGSDGSYRVKYNLARRSRGGTG